MIMDTALVKKIRKSMLSMKQLHIYPKNRHPKRIIENLALQLETINKVAQQLDQLETKLNAFDAEQAYAGIHARLIDEYNHAKNRYKSLEAQRKQKIANEEQAAREKRALVARLDPIVNALQKDFGACAQEKYLLLDEIFLVKTNSHLRCDFAKMSEMVDSVVGNHERILRQELAKMDRIHALLDAEETRLSLI